MIPYLGCDAARELLHGFVDGELPMADQVAVEAHLRWCRTCGAHVEDVRLIGASVRLGSPAQGTTAADVEELAAIQRDVLTRVRAERDQSLAVRLRGAFDDMHYLLPALGATAALVICLCAVALVTRVVRDQRPDSMADIIWLLANPGSDRNPLELTPTIRAPRRLSGDPVLESIPGEEVVFALATVVTREGRVAEARLLGAEPPTVRRTAVTTDVIEADDIEAGDIEALLDAVKQSRFMPAQTPSGAVAVNAVWVLARTTVKASAEEYDFGTLPR